MKDLKLQELQCIAAKHDGLLRPEDVVQTARNPKNVLHSSFEWDDSIAGHEFRLWQARQIIRVSVQYIENSAVVDPVKVYVSLKSDRAKQGGGYRQLVTVFSDEQLRAQLLQEAIEELQGFQRKYARLTELSGIFSEIQKVQEKMEEYSVIPEVRS